MPDTPYINLGSKQEAGTTDLAAALQAMIDEFVLTDHDLAVVKTILDDNGISYDL